MINLINMVWNKKLQLEIIKYVDTVTRIIRITNRACILQTYTRLEVGCKMPGFHKNFKSNSSKAKFFKLRFFNNLKFCQNLKPD